MRIGFRTRVFLVSLAIVAVALLFGGGWAEVSLRGILQARIESELVRLARAGQLTMQSQPANATDAQLERLAQDLSMAASVRVTLVRDDGTVLGDSDVAPERVGALENHRNRPEILEAMAHGVGTSSRYSATLKTDMLYVAVPYQRPDHRGVVRVAMPLHEVDGAAWHLRFALLAAGLLALGTSAVASGLSARYVAKSLQDLLYVTRAVAKRLPLGNVSDRDDSDVDVLVGSVNTMSQEFEATLVELGRERDRFGAVLEGMNEAVIAIDKQGHITLSNQAALRTLGWAQTPVGSTLLETIRQPVLHDLAIVASAAEPVQDEVEVELRDGKRLLARAARLSSEEGGAVLVMRDVTELRRLENTRRDFIANVSHELRTPVSTIRATAETLLGGALDDKEHATKFLQALLRNAERLSRIISDLLDLSRIEAGEYRIELQGVKVRHAVLRAAEVVESLAKEKAIAVANDVPEELRIVADEQAVEQVLLNLLDNAVKYTPPGGHVVVRASSSLGMTRVEVEDDGPGIEPKYRARVFERFYRLDPGRSRDLGGTGLGLSIVRNLMTRMGGKVGVEGAEPKGSVFWVELPTADRVSSVPIAPPPERT